MSRRQLSRAHGAADFSDEGDDTGCPILHVDMDAFYASVELIDRPELRGRSVIVGGEGRSVVLSATYEARRLGVHAAMPMSQARRICPKGIVIPPDHRRYGETSRRIMEIFQEVTPLVEPLSLDEAFLDVSGARRLLGEPAVIARRIRTRIAAQERITCSVGVASTKFVAKLASGLAKPDGLLIVPRNDTVLFLHGLSVGDLWGVGERTEATLHRLGLRTVADLAHTPLLTLIRALGEAMGTQLHALSWGKDPRSVVPERVEKSVGAEETFSHDIADPLAVHRELLRLSDRVASRLRATGSVGRTVAIKVRFDDFTTLSRSRSLSEHTDTTQTIYRVAGELFRGLGTRGTRIRLVGVRVEGLVEASAGHHQLELGERPQGWREAEQATDRIRARFGSAAVRPASLVDGEDPCRSGRRREQPGSGGSDG
jgi:DNA polymerase IV